MRADEVPDDVVSVTVAGKAYDVRLREVAERALIDPNHLDEEIDRQAAEYFWIATLAAYAEAQAGEAKRDLDIFLSELIQEHREKMLEPGGKAPAATVIEAAAKSDRRYLAAARIAYNAQRTAALLRVASDAIRMRHYLLLERSRRSAQMGRDEAQFE